MLLIATLVGLLLTSNIGSSGQQSSQKNSIEFDAPPAPKIIHDIRYPSLAFQNQIQGTVVVFLEIGLEGEVRRVTIVRSDKEILNVGVEAVKAWKFYPALRDFKPVVSWLEVPIHFRISIDHTQGRMVATARAEFPRPRVTPDASVSLMDSLPYETPPKLFRHVMPRFATNPFSARIELNMQFKILVGKDGLVKHVIVLKSDAEEFTESVREAIFFWVFKPAMLKQEPVSAWITFPFFLTSRPR